MGGKESNNGTSATYSSLTAQLEVGLSFSSLEAILGFQYPHGVAGKSVLINFTSPARFGLEARPSQQADNHQDTQMDSQEQAREARHKLKMHAVLDRPPQAPNPPSWQSTGVTGADFGTVGNMTGQDNID